MGNIGFGELLLILLVLLLVFGTSKLPQLGDALGRGIRNFKKTVSGDDAIDVTPKAGGELPSNATSTRQAETGSPTTPVKK
jgi:sec-independent protein translocase protein TatA